MKKKMIKRGFLGFPLGIAIGYLITVAISVVVDDGNFYPVVPELVDTCGTELNAVLLQTLLCGILGAASAASSVIWEMTEWSILKQTVLHFIVLSLSMLPIAYVTHWMEHTLVGVLSYFGIFVAAYVVIWFTQYMTWRRKIKEMNSKVS